MRKSIEITIFGVALGTYFMVRIVCAIPLISMIGTTSVITSCFIALFFPFLSKQKQIILSVLFPVSTIFYYPAVHDIVFPFAQYFENIYDRFIFELFGYRSTLIMTDPPLINLLIIAAYSQFFIQTFIFAWIYKKIGFYQKIPFMGVPT